MIKTYAMAVVLSSFAWEAVAADAPPTVGAKGGAAPKDNGDWTGDQVQIQANLTELVENASPPAAQRAAKKFVAPAYTRFDVSSDKDGSLVVTPRENFKKGEGTYIEVTPSATHRLYNTLNFNQPLGTIKVTVDSGNIVSPYVAYKVAKTEVEAIPYVKYGWSFGALLVPFKYHTGKKELNTSNSYQAYLQYKRQSNGLADGPFVAGGLATADIPNTDGSSSSKLGISAGLGWIFEVRKGSGFQLALMAGQDRFGSSANYSLDGKTWVAFSIGYQPQD